MRQTNIRYWWSFLLLNNNRWCMRSASSWILWNLIFKRLSRMLIRYPYHFFHSYTKPFLKSSSLRKYSPSTGSRMRILFWIYHYNSKFLILNSSIIQTQIDNIFKKWKTEPQSSKFCGKIFNFWILRKYASIHFKNEPLFY